MTALVDLKELNADRGVQGIAESWQMDAAQFVRDHGPALVELIEAAKSARDQSALFDERERAHQKFDAALRKLTEDKP